MADADSTAPEPRPTRYAVVGLGWIAQAAILPAFRNARRNSRLVALVSGDEAKRRVLADRYGVSHAVHYDGYEELLGGGEVDAVYIALPNHLHREYAVRAAELGVHVLCEKPMAPTVTDCTEMIRAATASGVRLMIAYRLHLEPANRAAVELISAGRIGAPRLISSLNTQQVEEGDVRLAARAKGGGPLFDIGVYCVNAARYLFGEEPLAVWGAAGESGDRRFRESEESVTAVLEFPEGRLAAFGVSFNAAQVSRFHVVGTEGELGLDPAYAFQGGRTLRLLRGGDVDEELFPGSDQFGPQLLYFSDCIASGIDPEPSGEEGLIDVRILEALHRSIDSGGRVALDSIGRAGRELPPPLRCPAIEEPDLVHASDPTE